MRSKIGIIFMLIGTALIAGALYLFLRNGTEDRVAQEQAQILMPQIFEEIRIAKDSPVPQWEIPENTPVELLTPEDLVMTETEINGYAYIGYLEIPELNLTLPVMSDWDMQRLKISPCRYTGSIRGEDLVIMAHNYASHFRRLINLSSGSQVLFTDMDGKLWNYEVVAIDILPGDAVEEMISGEYDLTLFTCVPNRRTHRVTVRCDLIE